MCGVQTERAPWGAPKRRRSGWANDRALRDWHHQRVQSRQRGLEWIRVLGNVSCAAREGTGYCLLEEIRWRPPKCDSRVPASQPPWYPTEPPHALRRATQARWVASARTTSGSIRAFRWMPPPWVATTLRVTYERPDRGHHGSNGADTLLSLSRGIPTHCHCSLVCLVDSSIFERAFRASRSEVVLVFFCWRKEVSCLFRYKVSCNA